MVFRTLIYLITLVGATTWADGYSDAAKAAEKGAQQANQNAINQLALANTTKDKDTEKLLRFMALQNLMQAMQFQQSQKENNKNSSNKEQSKEEDKDSLKITAPKETPNLLEDEKFNPKEDSQAAKAEEKAVVDESTIKKIFNEAEKPATANSQKEENPLSLLESLKKEQAAGEAAAAKKETAPEIPSAAAPTLKELTPIAEKNKKEGLPQTGPLPSENKLGNLGVPAVFFGNDAKKSNEVGVSDKIKNDSGRSVAAIDKSSTNSGGEGASGSSASDSGRGNSNFFDMLLNPAEQAAPPEEGVMASELQQEIDAREKKIANIFEYASFRYEIVAYRQKKVKVAVKTQPPKESFQSVNGPNPAQ